MPVSEWLNGIMSNGETIKTSFIWFNGFKLSLIGIYGAAPTVGGLAATDAFQGKCDCGN